MSIVQDRKCNIEETVWCETTFELFVSEAKEESGASELIKGGADKIMNK